MATEGDCVKARAVDYNPGYVQDVLGPLPSELEAMEVLGLIVAEWTSDPTSTACFDIRVVTRACGLVRDFEAKYKRFFAKYGRDPRKW